MLYLIKVSGKSGIGHMVDEGKTSLACQKDYHRN